MIFISRSYYMYFLLICMFCLVTVTIVTFLKEDINIKSFLLDIALKILIASFIIGLIFLFDEYNKQDLGFMNEVLVEEQDYYPKWEKSGFLPDYIEAFFYKINLFRFYNIILGGSTLIDKTIFLNLNDFILYFPNALFNGIFSPFPKFWYGESSSLIMLFAKIIIGLLTIFSYIFIFYFVHFSWKHKFDLKFIILFLILLGGICLIGYSCPNTGTLLRYRFSFYILLNCFGAAVLIEKLFYKFKV